LGTERTREADAGPYHFALQSASETEAYVIMTKGIPPVAQDDKIRVAYPVADQLVVSPLTVTGQARGTWYFEASFPVKLLDANGKVLVQTHAEAQENWMTEEFVPFTSVVIFPKPTTATGTLVLEKDNPSGLPEYDDSRSIPVRFSDAN
jgi:hypothetical protein